MKTYLDTETCGLHGLPVLLQYAFEDGPVNLFEPWLRPVKETLGLLEQLMDTVLVGFNLSFDHFHLCKLHTTWRLLDLDAIPAQLPVLKVAKAERLARDGPCLKPMGAMDLMLHSRKGEHQFLMSRNQIRVRKIPSPLAPILLEQLTARLAFDPILNPLWGIYDRKKKQVIDPEFKDIGLSFRPNRGLKSLAKHCLGLDPQLFRDIYPEREHKLYEVGYIPFALGCSDSDWRGYDNSGKLKGYTWPKHISGDIKHWNTHEKARKYAYDDVVYTRMLDKYFGYPEPNDNDSVLACMVAAIRWHGFEINSDQMRFLLGELEQVLKSSPVNYNSPAEVRKYIKEAMDPIEALVMDEHEGLKKTTQRGLDWIDESTKKANLEKIRDRFTLKEPEICITCLGEGCPRCEGTGNLEPGPMPVSKRAGEILKIKAAAKEADLLKKLVKAGRFHASFKVIGTLSSRMAGGDGLNAQGIKKSQRVREAFPLAWEGMTLCGGDFDSFEVTIAEAVFQDPQLKRDLLNGISVHTVMAQALYPDKSYEEILASRAADGGAIDMYSRGKQGVFAMLYGGDQGTIHRKLSIAMTVAEEAFERFQSKYPGIKIAREENFQRFSALRQEGGLGTEVKWHDPAEYSETFLGFKRYFTLENKICRELYDLAREVKFPMTLTHYKLQTHEPKVYKNEVSGVIECIPYTIDRRGHQQTLTGAVQSALYGAAFQLQAANTRAANNHLIQSPGAQITKALQVAIWGLQPSGSHAWVVAPLNIHDEVMCPTEPSHVDRLQIAVEDCVESFRLKVPLIGIQWARDMVSWGEKIKDHRAYTIEPDTVKLLSDLDDPDTDLMTFDQDLDEWEADE